VILERLFLCSSVSWSVGRCCRRSTDCWQASFIWHNGDRHSTKSIQHDRWEKNAFIFLFHSLSSRCTITH